MISTFEPGLFAQIIEEDIAAFVYGWADMAISRPESISSQQFDKDLYSACKRLANRVGREMEGLGLEAEQIQDAFHDFQVNFSEYSCYAYSKISERVFEAIIRHRKAKAEKIAEKFHARMLYLAGVA